LRLLLSFTPNKNEILFILRSGTEKKEKKEEIK
jgi:hypothetical protein